jgi:DNA-binding SARP family transcriptional activator
MVVTRRAGPYPLEGERVSEGRSLLADEPDARAAPPAPTSLIDRPRLEPELRQILNRRLTLVIAGAGYGKSTLLRAWAAGRRVAWVGLRDDANARGNLVAAIIEAFARIGLELRADLDPRLGSVASSDVGPPDPGRAEAVAVVLARALETALLGDTVLVLDDLETIAGGSAAPIVGALVRQAPARLHVVLIGRSAPPFPVERIRSQGELLELGVRDLRMNVDEIARVITAAYGSSDDALAQRLLDVTEGWPALVRLITESLRDVPSTQRPAAVVRSVESGEALFPYIAEEVFDAERPAVRELVRTVAPLESFDADLCASLGLEGAAEILGELRSRGMFLDASGDRPDRLTLHGLVREFALRRMPLTEPRLRNVRESAIGWLRSNGEIEPAIRLALQAGDPKILSELLREHGFDLIRRGRGDVVLDAAEVLEDVIPDVELALILGDAHAHRGDWRRAVAQYLAAAGQARPLPAAVAWRIGRLQFERSQFEAAEQVLGAATTEGASDRDRARLLAWQAMAAWHSADPAALGLAREATEVATATGDPGAISIAETATSYSLIGSDLQESQVHHVAAMRAADEAGDVIQQIRLRMAMDTFGRPEESLRELTRFLPVAEAAGNTRWLARARQSRAVTLLDLGRYDAAEDDLRQAAALSERLDPVEIAPALFLADLHRVRGDLVQAEAGFRQVIRIAAGDLDMAAYAKAGLARILARRAPAQASRLAREAVVEALPHHRGEALLADGWVALGQGRDAAARTRAEEVLGLEANAPGTGGSDSAHALELWAMASEELRERRAKLEEAQAAWKRLGNRTEAAAVALALSTLDAGAGSRAAATQAREQLRAAGVRQAAGDAACLLAMLPPERSPDLEIRTLGSFIVLHHGAPVALAEWKSKKAREVLKILIARGGAVSRDELIQLLWPDESSETTSSRLSVSLSLLRNVLDPQRRHSAETYLVADRDAIRLVTDDIVIDLEDFRTHAQAGLELRRQGRPVPALERLLAAEATSGGDLFQEDPFADWAVAPREEARAIYGQVTRAIAELLAGQGDDDGAARYLMRIIARDPYDEPAQLQRVVALARGRHHGEAREAYQAYVARMAELEIEAAPYPVGS